MTSHAHSQPVRLADYRPPSHAITDVELTFDIREGETTVTSKLAVERRDPAATTLVLDGEELELVSIAIDGRALTGNEYQVDDRSLTLLGVPQKAQIEIVTRVRPEANTALEGLYRTGSMYCTQCEAEGFRKITYYADRPDVLARFTTTIVADRARCPVLLSNGDLVGSGERDDVRHWATWRDPFPKPCYLFALVAGDLAERSDRFVTRSGRAVRLRVFSEAHNIDKCAFAIEALKRAMRWDEEIYGREYDLDTFMIVAAEDFNMGAMENKGLNIFNTSCVLATPDAATDDGYKRVEAVVAHEYFHNWSGNRVTCRDWFQLSLKEGFTVFRDSQFSGDMHSPMVKRIEDVEFLRTFQFPDDAGPLAHPVRPDSYLEISNFYTTTVYEKGAEVVRMMHTLLGPSRFRRGTDLYFDRNDGRAVTTEDFVAAMEDANAVDLQQFRRWYDQAGTPIVRIERRFADGALTLSIAQRCAPTPGQPVKEPFHIPLAIGLLDANGFEVLGAAGRARHPGVRVTADVDTENPTNDGTLIVHLKRPVTTVTISGLGAAPAISVPRGFSAPIKLELERDAQELAFLAQRDSDGFSRWDAMRALQCAASEQLRRGTTLDGALLELYGALLDEAQRSLHADSRALLAEMLALPAEAYLGDLLAEIDVDGVHRARASLEATIGRAHRDAWLAMHRARPRRFAPAADDMATRSLANLALSFLCAAAEGADARTCEALVLEQLANADNLTDRLAALRCALEAEWLGDVTRAAELAKFFERWRHEKLVVDAWFGLQASASRRGALARVTALERHAAFDAHNPNRARALYGAFAGQNPVNFHDRSGSGYEFLATRVIAIDAQNPQLASRLLMPMTRLRRYSPERQKSMRRELERVRTHPKCSKDVYELVAKSLAAD